VRSPGAHPEVSTSIRWPTGVTGHIVQVCLSLVGRRKEGWAERGVAAPLVGGKGDVIDVDGRNLELSLTEVLVQVMNI